MPEDGCTKNVEIIFFFLNAAQILKIKLTFNASMDNKLLLFPFKKWKMGVNVKKLFIEAYFHK